MFVAGTLDSDQELIQNIATVMEGARIGERGAGEDAPTAELRLQLSLTGRQPEDPGEPE